MRVLHVLHHSLPQLSGYSIRSSYILKHQQRQGHEVFAVTSAQQEGAPTEPVTLEGVPCRRTRAQAFTRSGVREAMLMKGLAGSIDEAVREFDPELIHAHSPVLVGLPALAVARRRGLPLVYEVRDLWENASVDRGKFRQGSLRYRLAQQLENPVLRRARGVVTICAELAKVLAPRVRRGTQVSVVANGVEVELFEPADGGELIDRHGLRGKAILGYVGAFQPYEGLEVLIGAMPEVLRQRPEAHLMIAGAGGVESELRRQVGSLGLEPSVTFLGRIPHESVRSFYAACRVMVYPRRLTATTALTTPLKPLEAMAMRRPVIASDLPAMRELVRDNETGYLFEAGNSGALAHRSLEVLGDPDQAEAVCERARRWVEAERTWPKLVAGYDTVYEAALGDAR